VVLLLSGLRLEYTAASRAFLEFGLCSYKGADVGIRDSYQVRCIESKPELSGPGSGESPLSALQSLVQQSGCYRGGSHDVGFVGRNIEACHEEFKERARPNVFEESSDRGVAPRQKGRTGGGT